MAQVLISLPHQSPRLSLELLAHKLQQRIFFPPLSLRAEAGGRQLLPLPPSSPRDNA